MGRPKKKVNLICPTCGINFQRYAYDVEQRGARWCSIKCHHKNLKKEIPVGILKFLYLDLSYSLNKISKMLHCSDATIKKRMIDGNIPLRTKKASQSLGQMGIEHSVEWNKAIAKIGRAHV